MDVNINMSTDDKIIELNEEIIELNCKLFDLQQTNKEQINNIKEKLRKNEVFMYTMSYYLLVLTILFSYNNISYI